MSITSETQRKYDPNKGGFSYYTLFHADKGERPSWAQDGDMLEEFGEGGKAYVCSRDAKGRIKWTEKADWDRQTGGGSGGGGGVEPFYVEATITEESEEYTVAFDKTYEETKAAHDAGSQIFLIADDMNYALGGCFFDGSEGQFFWTIGNELDDLVQIIMLGDSGDTFGVFAPVEGLPEGVPSYSSYNNGQVLGVDDGDLAWVDGNAPLIVTVTNGTGDKTYGEIHNAAYSGKHVVLKGSVEGSEFTLNVISTAKLEENSATVYQVYYNDAGADGHAEGSENDNFAFGG